MFHDRFGAADQFLTLLGVDFPVDLGRQGLKFLVVPERIVLRPVFAATAARAEGRLPVLTVGCRREA